MKFSVCLDKHFGRKKKGQKLVNVEKRAVKTKTKKRLFFFKDEKRSCKKCTNFFSYFSFGHYNCCNFFSRYILIFIIYFHFFKYRYQTKISDCIRQFICVCINNYSVNKV